MQVQKYKKQKQSGRRKMANHVTMNISVNELNKPIKRQRLPE